MLKVESYNVLEDLKSEQLVLFVASTFGNGDPPENGKVIIDKQVYKNCSFACN